MTAFLQTIYVLAVCTAVYLVGRAVRRGFEWLFDRALDWFAPKDGDQ